MTVEFRVGDVFARLAEIPDGSIDLLVTSPPFLALRSYLPADHPDKHLEIGSEPTPAEFLDTLLALTAEWGRVLAPHGSICVELGDTYASDQGRGSAWVAGGERFTDAGLTAAGRDGGGDRPTIPGRRMNTVSKFGNGWPLAKSMCLIPHLYTASLAYGRNLLTGEPSPAGSWRIRNVICWARPNPPVGALGDKFRPATSYITVACKSSKRYFDLDAVRGPGSPNTHARLAQGVESRPVNGKKAENPNNNYGSMLEVETAGAPPLDWHADNHPEDGDWLWKLPTQPYKGSHYAAFPLALPTRLIQAMCPQKVCVVCGRPSERIVEREQFILSGCHSSTFAKDPTAGRLIPKAEYLGNTKGRRQSGDDVVSAVVDGDNQGFVSKSTTTGWTDCGCPLRDCRTHYPECGDLDCPCPPDNHYVNHRAERWRTGVVLDPFAGSGTTLAAALGVGRHAIGIDLDERNADLARDRVGLFLDIDYGTQEPAA